MHDLARGGSEEPPVQGVDGGLEGHADGGGQVGREQVGGLHVRLTVAEQDGQDEGVPHGAEHEDE